MTSRTRHQPQRSQPSTAGIRQRPPFRWTCQTCGLSVITLVVATAAPTCSAHTGGGRQMVAERVRFRDLDRPAPRGDASQNERK